MPGDMRKVLIGCQKRETVLATGCGYQKIDRPGVDILRTTSHAKSPPDSTCRRKAWDVRMILPEPRPSQDQRPH